jgi:tetratricopeptide (TPR) repeat protein
MSLGHSDRLKWKSRVIWLLGALFLAATLSGCASLNEHIAMKDAAKAYKSGHFEEAAKDYEQALAINPSRAENWKYLAFCYWSLVTPGSMQKKDQDYTQKALNAFQKYLDIVGKDDQVQDYIINLYINQNLLADGIKYYEKALQKDPTDPRIMQILATMYGKMGNFPKSLEYSKKKAELTPNDPAGYLFIGALCWQRSYQKQDPDAERSQIVDEGVAALQKALQLDPKNFTGHLYMNLLYRQKSELAKNAADQEKNRQKKKELLQQADDFLTMANKERDIALEIRKGGSGSPATATAPGSPSANASQN